jgi:hypothetical protein
MDVNKHESVADTGNRPRTAYIVRHQAGSCGGGMESKDLYRHAFD